MSELFAAATFRLELGGSLGDASPYDGKAIFALGLAVDADPTAEMMASANFALAFDLLAGGEGISADFSATAQSLTPGDLVHLFKLDLTQATGEVLYFTPGPIAGTDNAGVVRFGGQDYAFVPVEIDGFEWNGTGSLAQPKLRVDAVNRAFVELVIGLGDLVGARVTYIKTFRQFLDGQPQADPNSHFPAEIYEIARKTSHNKAFIEWSLRAPIDREGRQLPGRVMFRDLCPLRYRFWNPNLDGVGQGGFDYSKATCPYTGDATFDAGNTAVEDVTLDTCGHRLSSCRIRFGDGADLPYGAFPGIALNH